MKKTHTCMLEDAPAPDCPLTLFQTGRDELDRVDRVEIRYGTKQPLQRPIRIERHRVERQVARLKQEQERHRSAIATGASFRS